MRLVTYNVEYSVAQALATLDAIAAIDADVVLLQEVTPAWEQALRARFDRAYAHAAFHARRGAGGLAVLARAPLRDDRLLPAVERFPAQHVIVDGPLGLVQLLHLHLHPMLDGGDPVRGYFSTPPIRRREIEAFTRALGPDLPAIVAGDLNEEPGGGVLGFLEARGLRRVDTGAAPTWRFDGTWRGNPVKLGLRLDHVAIGAPLVARDAAVIDAGGSDHLPVVVTIQRSDQLP
jgi:endonuclease/exonuclease/phosphatase (EEP) superfamily protein YafD